MDSSPRGFPRHGYWSGLPIPSPEDLPDPWIEPAFTAFHADSLSMSSWGIPGHW